DPQTTTAPKALLLGSQVRYSPPNRSGHGLQRSQSPPPPRAGCERSAPANPNRRRQAGQGRSIPERSFGASAAVISEGVGLTFHTFGFAGVKTNSAAPCSDIVLRPTARANHITLRAGMWLNPNRHGRLRARSSAVR